MELLVVIFILIITSAIAVPVIQAMLDDGRLQGATDMIRAKVAEARANAMETGNPWRVAFIPGTGVIQVAPDDATEWEQADTNLMQRPGLIRQELPQFVYIGAGPGDIQGAGATPSPGANWHTIAVYTYDGSAREDSITYFGKYGTPPMAMELRALTGSVTMKTSTEVTAMHP
jgi:type II secretory pathway pseudopilin PulG